MSSVMEAEARRTNPDFVVFVPPEPTPGLPQVEQHNMHMIVAPIPGGDFLATWTQADSPHGPDQRVVIARSSDRGESWSEPEVIDAPDEGAENIASWSTLVAAPETGNIFCLYHKNTGVVDYDRGMTGELAWRCSVDGGRSWGERYQTPIRRSAIDHPDASVPSNWVTAGWQLPIVTRGGAVLCPITRWASRQHRFREEFSGQEHEGWFLRFDNILTVADPADLQVTTLPEGDRGLRIPHPDAPETSAAMEPAIQNLGDGRIFCVLRTMTGSIYHALSTDEGTSWSEPRELCYVPGGSPILHPNAPIGLGRLEDGRFIILFHNNDGTANGGSGPADSKGRRPVFLSVGKEIDNPDGQPIIFGDPVELYDNGGPSRPHSGLLAPYGSFFVFERKNYWWYPDAIRFQVGRIIPNEVLV